MSNRVSIYKKASNIIGIVMMLLGFVPVPGISQVSGVYANVTVVESRSASLPEFSASYAGLLGDSVLSCEGEECEPEVTTEAETTTDGTTVESTEEAPVEEIAESEPITTEEELCELGDSDVDGVSDCSDEFPLDPMNGATVESSSVESEVTQGDETQTEVVDIQAEVNALAEADAVLLDENKEPIPLTSEEAYNTLSSADPYFTSGGVKYCYLHVGETPAANCDFVYFSATPIQDAIDAAGSLPPDDDTIYVEPGVYEENITIDIEGLTLYGDPGDELLAGADANAPVLQGGFSGDTGVGVTITAQGATIMGFIIQGYDIGILADAASGNIDIEVLNNTIKNNTIGIKNQGSTGKPNMEIHYNSFQDNDVALDNNSTLAGSVNVQYINAQMNDWGCPQGPVVYDEGEDEYYLWSTKELIDYPTEYGDCELLDGVPSLWDHQKNTPDWSPFKINLGALADPEEPEEEVEDLQLSLICLGEGQFSWSVTNPNNFAILDVKVEVDGNVEYEGAIAANGQIGDTLISGIATSHTLEVSWEGQGYASTESDVCEGAGVLDLQLNVVCLGAGQFSWSVTNPNNFTAENVNVALNGKVVFDSEILANTTVVVGTTADGPAYQYMDVIWGNIQHLYLESTQVCTDDPTPQDPPIPVTGTQFLIPVTGLDLTSAPPALSLVLAAGGSSALALGYALTKRRKDE